MKELIVIFAVLLFVSKAADSQIIDMHLHSYTESEYWLDSPPLRGIESPATVKEHLDQTIQLLDKHKIEWAVVCGSLESVEIWTSADKRFIPGLTDKQKLPDVSKFEDLVKAGKIKVFGEILAVYQGRTLNDSIYQPYLEICEEYGIPVAYHTGGGPPMIPYHPCCPDFRISFGDPFLIEDVLVRYPKLKIYLMHGGEVFFEHAIRMMKLYSHLYIDLGVLLWVDPMTEDYAVRLLRMAKKIGVLDRVMFGSDQMVWPGAITSSIEFLNSIEFLTDEDKNMILYQNARKFLGIDAQ